MSFFTLNTNKYLIFIAVYWIIEISQRLFLKLKWDYFMLVENFAQNLYVLAVFRTVADLLSGFLLIYINYSSKSQKEKIIGTKEKEDDDLNSKNKITLIYEEPDLLPQKFIFRNFIIIIIIISILEYLSRSNYWITNAIFDANQKEISEQLQRDNKFFVDIFLRYIFSFIILKTKIYKHHKFSLITNFVGFLFLIIADIIYYKCIKEYNNLINNIFQSSLFLIKAIAYPLEHTLIQKLFKENFIFPAKVQFLRGILNIIIVIV